MKFDEMITSTKATKKANNLKIVFIIIISITVFALVFILIRTFSPKEDTKSVSLDTDGRLVQSLYNSVHDFKSASPYWMYFNDESGGVIANMAEGNKMALAYLNLKGNDFQEADNCEDLPQENTYGKLVCSDRTIVKRKDVERSYKEVFGDKVQMNTVSMKVNQDNDTYVYNENIDSYVLYSKGNDTDKIPQKYKYIYDVYKAEKVGDTIRIFESLSIENDLGNVERTEKYLYIFKLADDGLYSFYKLESVVD